MFSGKINTRWLLVSVSISLVATAFSPARADTGQITIPLPVPTVDVCRLANDAADFELPANLPTGNIQWLGETGQPQLPYQVVTLLLPPTADLSTVTANLVDAAFIPIAGRWDVAPIAPPANRTDDAVVVKWPADRTLAAGRDVDIYTSSTAWPYAEVQMLNVGQLREYRLVQVAIPLFKCRPATGELLRLNSTLLNVNYAGGADSAELDQPRISDTERLVRNIAINYRDASPAYENDDGPNRGRDATTYLVITTDAIAADSTQLTAFVAHKQNLGFNVLVITEADFGGGTGDVAAENIRTWLQNHYATDQISHVLIIGNPDPSAAGVPMKMTHPTTIESTPTDYYFADLTGDWDLDNDGQTGEYADDFGPGGVDRFAELIVGRIPCYGNISDLDAILAKTITYETDPDPAWRRSVLLPMRPSDDDTPGFQLGEAIKDDLLTVKNWPYHRIYDDDFGLNPPPETTPCTEPIVTDIWTADPFGLVVWWTHGNITYASGVMSTGAAANLNDAYPAFTFQASCGNAYAEDEDNLAYALLRNGGIVTIGATRTSWYIIGQVIFADSPSNAGMAYEYAARIVGARTTAGFALNDIRERIYPTQAEFWKNYVAFNIYGDPSLHLLPLEARRYVNAAATAGGDGASWETAYNELQDALADVPAEIWIAQGTYTPDRGTQDRELSFQLVNGVEIYGGFAGDESTIFQRNPSSHPTVFSGDLLSDDAADFANRDDNSYHVVTGRNTDETALLDGIIIRGGAANYGSNDDGGGLWCEVSGSPTIRNCIFEENIAKYGAAVRCDGSSHPTLINCNFRNNLADVYGSGYGAGLSLNSLSSPTLYNCLFVGNTAANSGGGLYFRTNTVPTLVNCTFARNHAYNGGGVYGNNSSSDFFVTNCIFWGNTRYVWGQGEVADEAGQIMNTWGITINNSCVQEWSGDMGGVANFGDDPLLVDTDGADDIPGTADDDLHVAADSPAIDAGDNSAVPDWLLLDLDGAARIQNNTVDLGVYESPPAGGLPGDCDVDNDVDFADISTTFGCLAGPDATIGPECDCADLDTDSDADLADLLRLQPEFTGPLPE